MSFAALAKMAKASSKGEAAVERPERSNNSALYNSTRGSAILNDVQSVLNNKSESTDAPDALGLALPQIGSSLPEHPSTKSQLASSASKVKPNAAFSKNFLAAVKAQIAKEHEQERLIEAASAHDSSVRVFTKHLRTKEASECIGNTDCVNCLALLSNGEFASGSGDGRVLIWNEGTGEVIQVLQNHEGPVLSMAISHSGLRLITGSSDMSMKKWNLSEPIISQDQQYKGHTRWVQCVAVHRDFVFSASLDKTVRQWDLVDGKCNFIFAGHADWVSSLCVHHQTLYTGSWDGIVRLWSISTWECTHLFEGHTGPVLSICLDVKDPDAKPNFIYSASQDGRVKRWSLIDYVELNSYSGHVLGVSTVDCSSTFLASGSFDSTIRLYDLNVTEPLHVLYGHEDSVTCVKFSINGLNLYSSSDDFTIRKWDCKTGVCLRIYGIPKSQQLIRGAGVDGKKSGSLSLLLNFGDDDDPTSLRSRLRKILREEENESILLEHEFSRRLELYKNRLLADHLKEKEGQAAPRGSTQSSGGNPNFDDSVVLDLKDDYQNQRYGLIAVYSDAKEALREDVLDCAGLGASAVQLLWENKQEALKVAWLECQNKAVPPSLVSASEDQLDPDFDPAEVASSILHGILDSIEPATATLLTPEVVAQGILSGILDFICKSQAGTVPDASRSVPKAKASLQKSAFDAKSASIDVSDVSLDDALSPQLLACLNSTLHRANRRFHRSKSAFNAKFFDSVMLQADDRERRIQHLESSVLDQEERKMLLQQEETRTLALISAEAREIHTILTQVASEIDRLVSDHRQIWLFKFSGLFTESQWQQLETAVAELILKHQSQSDELYAAFDRFCSEVASKGQPLSSIEERCEQMNDQMSDLQKRLDDELLRVLMGFDFMTADLLAQLRTVFGRDSSAVMLQFKLEIDRQAKRSVDDALERARLEDIEKEETARLAAKKAFKDKMQREAETAKLAKLDSLKASESLRAKQKLNFEMDLAKSLKSEDFSDLENTCFAFLHRYDLRRRPVLVLKMANFPVDPCLEGRPQVDDFEAPSDDWQRRIMRYVMLKLDQIIETPGSTHEHVSRYLLVVDFSNSSPSCRPSILFLQQAWYFLPDRARTLMDECVIIDSPFWFRAFVWFMKPIVSHRVWKKVRFLRQYSDLWGLLSHTDLRNISSSDKSGNKVFAFSGEASAIHGKPSFLSMLSRARTAHLIKGQDSQDFFEKYFEIINAAKVADWSDIMELHFLDTSGVDILGRPVIMFIASNFPCKLGESFLNRCLVYIMLKVHELMFEQKKQVSILVICSNISTNNIPSTAWLQAAAKRFPYKIRKMIQCIFLLNPGFLVKKLLWVLRSIASPKIANKLVEVETLLQLLRHFNHVDLRLPPSVLQDVPFGGTPEEKKMMTADIRAAIKRGQDVGLDQKVDFSQQFKLGVPSDHDIQSFFTLTCNDFEDINGKEIVKFAGRDIAKRPVISITLANVPASKGEIVMNKVFRLVVLLLQPLSQLPYSIALIATNFAAANQPGIDWMKDVHKSIDSAARKNLRAVYLFEPTFLVKSATFALQSFVSTKFFKKIHLITDSDDFYQHIDPNGSILPKSIISRYLRTPTVPVLSARAAQPSTNPVPPEFVEISQQRFAELANRALADFGDEFDDTAQVSGVDIFGDPIIVVDGSKINTSSEDAFVSCVFYLLALARENINQDESFSIAYCDDVENDKTPSSDWLRGAYSLIPKHFRKNIKHMFCINSTQSLRMFFWFANTFVSAKFTQKVVHILDTADLAEYLDDQQTKLPPSVLERLPIADARKMSLAMVRRSRALMSRQLAPKAVSSTVAADSPGFADFSQGQGSSAGLIEAAYSADMSAAQALDCIFLSQTLQGLPCVMIQVSKLPDAQHPEYRKVMVALFLLLVVSIDSVSKKHPDAKYCLFLSNIGSSSGNRPSMEWLRAFHAQLPHQMRKNCVNVFIYMPSLAMRAFLGTARLFLSSKFFKKLVNLTSESATEQYFDALGHEFNLVTGKVADTSSTRSRSGPVTASQNQLEAVVVPSVSSQPSATQLRVEQSSAAPKVQPPTQVTRFRNVNGKPVVRSSVPLGQLPWATPYSGYSPTVFTSEGFPGSVRSSIRSAKNPLGPADLDDIHEVIYGLTASAFEELRQSEEDIDALGLPETISSTALGNLRRLRFSHTGRLARNEKGYPLNPAGRTGLSGRAHHFLWGPNHRALPVIVRCSSVDREQHLQMLMTSDQLTDAGVAVWSLPESPVPAGHCISPQLLKGLEQQAISHVDQFDDSSQHEIRSQFQTLFKPGGTSPDNVLYAGVWDQPGNTDHAWSEALCILVLLEEQLAKKLDNGSENATWVPYDSSMSFNELHSPLIYEALRRLSQRGVCDIEGNVSSGIGAFSLSSSLAGLEKSVSSMFTMEAFAEGPIEDDQVRYEELEKQDGLYAESTVEARRALVIRYRKVGNIRAAKALEALDRTDVVGGEESFPKGNVDVGVSSANSAYSAGVSSHQEEYTDTMSRLYQTRVQTLGRHDPLTVSLRKQLCKELSNQGRFEEAAEIRSQAMAYDPT